MAKFNIPKFNSPQRAPLISSPIQPIERPQTNHSENHIVIEPPQGWIILDIGEWWQYREMLYFLAWRDIKIRYRQTFLGAAWAVFQPLLSMILFTIIFGELAKLPSDDIPYPVFTYSALLPWQLFSYALNSASNSLVNHQAMVSKIYFPRLFLPISSIVVGVLDFGIAFIVLLGLMLYDGIVPVIQILWLPLLLVAIIFVALAIGIWLAAINVRYRDVRHLVPFLTQFWMYATPIAYTAKLIPEKWYWLYCLNPMVGIVEGFRWALLGKSSLEPNYMLISFAITVVLLVTGVMYFQHTEATFADVI